MGKEFLTTEGTDKTDKGRSDEDGFVKSGESVAD
jgi:hypothetical protein